MTALPNLVPENHAEQPLNTARILLIEDDCDVSNAVARLLKKKGYHCVQSFDGREGLITALNQNFDLILLDKLLPSLDGLVLLNKYRQYKDTPVLMMSACGQEQDRINGFTGGVDDYLPKPFNMTELELRMDALLRRSRWQIKPLKNGRTIKDGILALDTHEKQATAAEQSLDLTPIEFELLKVFIEHKDETLSKPYLYQLVLKKPYSRYDRALDMHVSNLRSKLLSVGISQKIVTVRSQGYCCK